MKLYDNDACRDEFMELVYSLLHSDGTNDRANQIIDAFDSAIAVEAEPIPPNDPLTLEELRGMDGEPVWVKFPKCPEASGWMLISASRHCVYDGLLGDCDFENCGKTWLAYRRKPEENT